MRVPLELTDLLAIAIRDLVWYKKSVIALLRECGVPAGIVVEAERMYKDGDKTIPVIKHVLDRCANQAEEGVLPQRTLLTRIYRWPSLTTVPADRRDAARAALTAFQGGFDRFQKTQEYQRAQEAQEREMHAERAERRSLSDLDHAKLHGFRDEFDRISSIKNPNERGLALERLMNDIIAYYAEDSRGAIRRTGEQIDGSFKLDSHWHYVEVRWKDEQTTAADISVLRDRARSSFGGDTKALFISLNGFTKECLDSLVNMGDERVILMDGYDLRCVLNCDIALDVLLAEKQASLVREKRPFTSAAGIVQSRRGAGR